MAIDHSSTEVCLQDMMHGSEQTPQTWVSRLSRFESHRVKTTGRECKTGEKEKRFPTHRAAEEDVESKWREME